MPQIQQRPQFLKNRRKNVFIWTKKRLRTENRLLRQRIDYLEHESSALADRLVRGQVDLAQQADNCLNISHELHVLRDINTDAHRRLEEAFETIRQLSSKNKAEQGLTDTATQVDDTSMIEHIHQLQQELIEAHTKKSDLESSVRELKLRVQELESSNKRLRESPPDGGVAALQEELIRVKMREAEAALSLKEMRQRIQELENHWMRYQEARTKTEAQSPTSPNASTDAPNTSADSTTSTSSNPLSARNRLAKLTAGWMGGSASNEAEPSLKELEEQIMGLRIREADMNVELQEMSQKVMELETQNHVCSNQLKRQDEELKRVTEERDMLNKTEQEMSGKVKDLEHKLLAAESEMKEKNVMQRLKYTEALQNISDLKQHIAQLESKNAEKFATAQLRGLVDMDEDSIASNRSNGSLGDATSINSEEMSAFLAEVTLRHSNAPTNSDSLLDETDEEDERGDEKKRKSTKPQKKNHEDTADSGLDGVHLSDN
ncbi:unnamed protein product [Bursaphelenchus okinawaensis]|uniref:Uncharacterized protein n=1 Tax=Bursaphelenchus okinawaensis TaxID=465554 RepID=A0A811LIW3_9BILA|nr:unnamed protein product [Bursaphelenchus okinawaensis]CAG9124479.1 unnamed protein product [Bursaphelenchus okinawaensis]